MLVGTAAPASAQDGGALHACVRVDRHGDLNGRLRIVDPGQRCGNREAHVILPLAGSGGGIPGPPGPAGPQGPQGPPGPPGTGGGGSYDGGGIKGVLTECNVPRAGSIAYLNGHSFVVYIGEDASATVTGSFEMHHVPPATYDVVLVTPNLAPLIMEAVPVISGETTDLGNINLCFQD
jgi:hypothetical protein